MNRPSSPALLFFVSDPDHEWPLRDPGRPRRENQPRRRRATPRRRSSTVATRATAYAGVLGVLLLLLAR